MEHSEMKTVGFKDDTSYTLPSITISEPSYTRLKLAYDVVCRQRYNKEVLKQRRQFIKELEFFELMQGSALDGVRVHREFTNGILSHTIPTKNNMDRITVGQFTPQQQRRLDEILKNPVKFE